MLSIIVVFIEELYLSSVSVRNGHPLTGNTQTPALYGVR